MVTPIRAVQHIMQATGTTPSGYSADTEILTRQGWCRHDQISTGTEVLTLNRRSGLAEWQPCANVNRFDGPGSNGFLVP